VGAFLGVGNAKTRGSSPEMPKTGSPLAKGELHCITTGVSYDTGAVYCTGPVLLYCTLYCAVLVVYSLNAVLLWLYCAVTSTVL
jgi:hypothetical protein